MAILRQYLLSFLCFLLLMQATQAQVDSLNLKPYTADVKDFTINNAEDKISVTSQSPLLLRDAPGTVSVISEDEIQRAGARDLNDVLRLIPGFEFYMDVQGVIGIGSRGNSANEATLVLVDGMEMNELLYGSNQFGNHFPIDQIRRIEVIRGPGSVIYGGFAVYAVINILTKSSDWTNGVQIGQTVGETEKGMARRNFSGSFGTVQPKFKFAATGNISEANRSDRTYTDLSGNSYDMLDNSQIKSKFLVANFNTGQLFVKGLIDQYHLQERDNQTDISARAYPVNFDSYHLDVRYQLKPTKSLTVIPYANIRRQLPWTTPPGVDSVDEDKVIVFKTAVTRLQFGANATWKARHNLDFLFSASSFRDESRNYLESDSSASEYARYTCETVLTQAIWKTRIVNFTLGLRFDYHSYYNPILSPRIALNKTVGHWHFKSSFNRSFRTPAIDNISLSLEDKIQPQVTNYWEAEVGVSASRKLQLNLNYYHISAQNGIVYSVLPDGFTEGYSNAAKMGTQGIETEARFNHASLFLQAGYSFYSTRGMKQYCPFHVPGTGLNMALPAQKATLQSNFPIFKKIRLNNTFIWLSDRYGFNGEKENPVYLNYGQVFQWNIFLQAKDVYLKGLSIGAGIFDITNSRYSYIQSYNSGHMPLPAMSREFVLKVVYGLHINK